MPRVFISHSSLDRKLVEGQIVHLLRDNHIDTWYSPDDIAPGEQWQARMREGLEQCDWFLVALSPRSVLSQYVRVEVARALDRRRERFIPVLLEDCDPFELNVLLPSLNHLDFHSDLRAAQRKLLGRLGVGAPAPRQPERVLLPTQASRPRPARVHLLRVMDRDVVAVPATIRSCHALLKLVATGGAVPPARRNLVAVIDVSATMHLEDGTGESRLWRARRCLLACLRRLRPPAHVGLVGFGHNAAVALPPTPLDRWERIESALEQVERWPIDPTGHALDRGLALGLREVAHLAGPGRASHLVVLTAGEMSGETACHELAQRAAHLSARLDLFGVGKDFDRGLLEKLAWLGEGSWGHVDASGARAAEQVFAKALEAGPGEPFANTELRVRPARGVEVPTLLRLAPERRAVDLVEVGGGLLVASLGKLERDRVTDYLLELQVSGRAHGKVTLASVEVRFNTGLGQDTSGAVALEVTFGAADGPCNPGPTRFAEALWEAAEAAPAPRPEPPALGGVCTRCATQAHAGELRCPRCQSPLAQALGTLFYQRYRAEQVLAVGSFSRVYLALDMVAQRRVVVKEMLAGPPEEDAVRFNFFRREAEVLRQLACCPLVPQLYDFLTVGQAAHLVMEHLPGADLAKLLAESDNRPFAVDQVVRWGIVLCDLLAHLHGQSPPLLRRDTRPQDLILLEDRRSLRVVDFGCARDLGRSPQERLAPKTRVFTEGYAAPEQAEGRPEPRSDLFALAATLYHLATGRPPAGPSTGRVCADLASPASRVPAADRWFFELLAVNLAESPFDRYHSAQEVKRDLTLRQVARQVACPGCRRPNRARQPYCDGCRQPLTPLSPLPCGGCGTFNHLGVRSCRACGRSGVG